MALGFMGLFLQRIEKLAVVQDAADRRLGFGRNLDQVQLLFPGDLQGLGDGEDADLVLFFVDQADFLGRDLLVDPVRDSFSCWGWVY